MQNTEQYHDHNKNPLQGYAEKYRDYNKRVYLFLVIICIVSWLLLVVPLIIGSASSTDDTTIQGGPLAIISQIGLFILIAELVSVMVYDWRGVISLRGSVKRQTMHKGKPVSTAPGFFLLYLFLPEFMLLIYLVRVYNDSHKSKANKQMEVRHQIAVMEAQLGILPTTEGTCRSCKKPLQLGAGFCSYCGETVIERPKICPSCATTTFADAKFCPNCRLSLT